MPDLRSRLPAAALAAVLASASALALAPTAFADVPAGGDTAGGSILFWLTVIACVGIVVGTVAFYTYRRRHPR